jgi:hypothetical protein
MRGRVASGPGGSGRGMRERGERANVAMGCWPVGPGDTVLGHGLNSVLNGFKNIQTVRMKFEFLQILAGSKDNFSHSKNLK